MHYKSEKNIPWRESGFNTPPCATPGCNATCSSAQNCQRELLGKNERSNWAFIALMVFVSFGVLVSIFS